MDFTDPTDLRKESEKQNKFLIFARLEKTQEHEGDGNVYHSQSLEEGWKETREVRVFANGPGDLGSIPGRVIPKTQKMVLDASLLNTQHYKVRIKGKVEQSRERSSALGVVSYRKGSLRVTLDYGRQLLHHSTVKIS